jgi:anthranilate phosphoribosyltransferase
MQHILTLLSEQKTLTAAEASEAMQILLNGNATNEQTAAFLMGLRTRGESLEELSAFTQTMRDFAVKVACKDENAIDVCGTGGDKSGTFNISTTVALVCAGAGVSVAKHGNRSISSKSGSADVLEALGVKTDLSAVEVERCLSENGIAFLFAPLFHPALRFVMPVRRALGVRTFFNILGPLCNPAQVNRQLVGAFSVEMAATMANIMHRLGTVSGYTVCSDDGLDELSTASDATIFWCTAEEPKSIRFKPESLGFNRANPSDLLGGTASENATILQNILSGKDKTAKTDTVLLNAAFALATSGKTGDVKQSLEAAKQSLYDGKALEKLAMLQEFI